VASKKKDKIQLVIGQQIKDRHRLVPPVRVGSALAREWRFAGVSPGDTGHDANPILALAVLSGGEKKRFER
jgi:hypothetical protein